MNRIRFSGFFQIAPIFLFSIIITSCSTYKNTKDNNFANIVDINKSGLKKIFRNPNKYELQIIYSQINREGADSVWFKDIKYRVNSTKYFYPASTVKLPVALLTVEHLEELADKNLNLTIRTPYFIEGDLTEHSIADDIHQIFAISNNEAYNRLYDFLGRNYINSKLKEKGITPVNIVHRLSIPNSDFNETKEIKFYTSQLDSLLIPSQANTPIIPLNINNLQKGKGHMHSGLLIKKPMDFSLKNYFPLEAQHNLMKRFFFPDNFNKTETFNLNKSDKAFIESSMSLPPRLQGFNEKEYYDSYGKFFIFGDSKKQIPDHIKIYNKVGYSYGTLTETAYITDQKNNIEFLLSATILVNKNKIFNDDTYEFETVGIPFLAELGRQIYAHELKRKKL